METEVVLASVVASHAYDGGLSGCPLPDFLRAFVAELNIDSDYIAGTDFTLVVPQAFARISVGLLSAADTSWRRREARVSGDGCSGVQARSILLADFSWSENKDQNDGVFPVT
jgi:hypothetical protein